MQQGSAEWFAARLGKVTASRVADVVAKTKSGPSASRKNYAAELILERLTGQATETFTSAAMQWGIDTEPQARAGYEFLTDSTVETVGFIDHPLIDMSGASPDGLVGNDGLIEIKCPIPATHLDTLRSGKVPERYITQMQWQMACTGRAWCDFVSFDPRFPENLQMFRERIERDADRIAELEREVTIFLSEIAEAVRQLSRIGDEPNFMMAG